MHPEEQLHFLRRCECNMTKELVIVSSKGETVITSPTALSALRATRSAVRDSKVNLLDLQSVQPPRSKQRREFRNGHKVVIRNQDCICCGVCLRYCRFDAIKVIKTSTGSETFSIETAACNGCGLCVGSCPVDAIDLLERTCGE